MTLDQLEALKVPEIRKAFLEVMQNIVDRAIINEMIAAIETNDVDRLLRAAGFSPAALEPLIESIEQTYKDSVRATVDTFPDRIITPTGPISFVFNFRNPRVEEDLRINSSTLITRLTDEARENVRAVLEQGVIKGENPRKTAIDIVGTVDPLTKKRTGGVVGLTNNQAGWVRNGTRYLETLDSKYFNMTLRDKRFDSIVQKAIDGGENLSSSDVNRIMTAYKNRALRYRGETIARTETIQSINRGEFIANKQLVDTGAVSNSAMTKEWDDAGDGKVRSAHRFLANKYGKNKGIPIDEPFQSNDGQRLMFPGDSSLGASAHEIANCRCRLHVRVNWLAGVE
jgi:hypothetical protein